MDNVDNVDNMDNSDNVNSVDSWSIGQQRVTNETQSLGS
jgi:hypothetical protein